MQVKFVIDLKGIYNGYDDEKTAEKAVELIFNNKINAKNAFDVNVSFLENLPKFLNNKEESTWHRTSSSLDASVKIFGYRVDSVHSDNFKFLGGLNRAKFDDEEETVKEKDKKRVERTNGPHDVLQLVK